MHSATRNIYAYYVSAIAAHRWRGRIEYKNIQQLQETHNNGAIQLPQLSLTICTISNTQTHKHTNLTNHSYLKLTRSVPNVLVYIIGQV